MNLKDLNNIDIKDLQNIDWNDIKDRLMSQPHLIVNILLAIITVFVLFSTSKKLAVSAKQLKTEQASLKTKLAALEQFNAVKKENKDFLEKMPQAITDDQLIETFSEFAFQRNVQIISFSPAQKKSNSLLTLTSIELNIVSENYENIILFIHDIENSPYAIRIGQWSGKSIKQGEISQGQSRNANRPDDAEEETKEYIQATVKIESMELKNV
ncbi:MAG TPA: type 4a pilus biogenesis protein PilO [Candidatus Omnitrophota bacterium]|nr:type 4a pilus biogenesis protein PilO [Candidatus Omnitrophota bacterium]